MKFLINIVLLYDAGLIGIFLALTVPTILSNTSG